MEGKDQQNDKYFGFFKIVFVCQRCVGMKEYMAMDIDKYHCPTCETTCGASMSKHKRNQKNLKIHKNTVEFYSENPFE